MSRQTLTSSLQSQRRSDKFPIDFPELPTTVTLLLNASTGSNPEPIILVNFI